jgi:rod shape determining protein RodA
MGGQRWLNLYIFNLQPSELMKIGLILALARYFHSLSPEETQQTKKLILPLLMIFIPALLVLKQPDLGTAVMLCISGVIIVFLSGVQIWKFFVAGGIVLASLPLLWNKLHAYQQKRILVFLNPELDPSHSGYHVLQSKIALGSGGLLGKGYMQGTQSHLNFLPEKQTDFIFTMFSEEWGMVGATVLIILYAMTVFYGYQIALSSRNRFVSLLSLGVISIFFFYMFINISMVMGLVPVVGVPLPLVSYGGTSMITVLFSFGLMLSGKIFSGQRGIRGF